MRTMGTAAALLSAFAVVGCINLDLAAYRTRPLEERIVFGERGDKVLLVDVDGVLSEQGERGTLGIGGRESIVSRIREQLELAARDEAIRALLLRIHSPGGTAAASEILHGEILRFKNDRSVPVVAQLMGVAASGGYYVAMAADTIRAYPTTVTGSIGVVFAGVNLSGLMDKLGIGDQTLKSGAFKDAGSPLRPMTREERAQLQSVVDDLYGRFLEVVEAGRPALSAARIRALADGRVYSAEQALEAGLIDALGDLPSAVEEAKRRAGLTDARVVVYQRPGELRENLYSPRARGAAAPGASFPFGLEGPAFLYLWWPAPS